MSGINGDAHLYEDRFTVTEYNQEKYDRVARIKANSNDNSTLLELDINIELYPCQPGEELNVVLATTLSLDGSKDENKGWRGQLANANEPTLADQFDYVCYGKIYKFEEAEDQSSIKVFLSFGGLLMCLEGPFKKLTALRVEYCYLLVRK